MPISFLISYVVQYSQMIRTNYRCTDRADFCKYRDNQNITIINVVSTIISAVTNTKDPEIIEL